MHHAYQLISHTAKQGNDGLPESICLRFYRLLVLLTGKLLPCRRHTGCLSGDHSSAFVKDRTDLFNDQLPFGLDRRFTFFGHHLVPKTNDLLPQLLTPCLHSSAGTAALVRKRGPSGLDRCLALLRQHAVPCGTQLTAHHRNKRLASISGRLSFRSDRLALCPDGRFALLCQHPVPRRLHPRLSIRRALADLSAPAAAFFRPCAALGLHLRKRVFGHRRL